MIAFIQGIFNLLRGLFIGGGFFSKAFTFLGSGFASVLTAIGSFASLVFGGFAVIGQIWGYIAAYHAIEVIRRFFLIAFISAVIGFVLNYFLSDFIIYDGNSISSLFNSLITSIESLGAVGNNLLAFAYKLGVFVDLQIFLFSLIFALEVKIALKIFFK